jgi:predicted metalloprotease with PDZ domain
MRAINMGSTVVRSAIAGSISHMKKIAAADTQTPPCRTKSSGLIGKLTWLGLLGICASFAMNPALAQVGVGPTAVAPPPALPQPADRPFHGVIELAINATDTDHQVFSVQETIPVQQPGDMVLFYPEWETGSHAPTASVIELAGLLVHIDGQRVEWRRDPVDMHAVHLAVPVGARTVTLEFQFLAPARANLLRPDMVVVPWHRMLLYPAGWYVRDLPVKAALTLPQGLHAFTSLAFQPDKAGALRFAPVTLERLADAPIYAARYWRQLPLGTDATTPVNLDLVADAAGALVVAPTELKRMKKLLAQTLKVFGAAPYRHYDAIVSLSDELPHSGGIEHLEEGENNLPANYFSDVDKQLNNRDLIAHELVHAWNGRWRQPADLWSPTFNQPADGSLLWVYEGQTEFWGRVLAARAGMRDRQQTLDKLAIDADVVANRSGRAWKTLQDSANDATYMAGNRVTWRDWQRREDYYPEGVLLWLDVDARLRELSGGQHGLDDFAHQFFKSDGSNAGSKTYTFDDVCAALNAVAANDWAAFLRRHLDTHASADAIAGLARAGWQLTYSDAPSATFRQDEQDGQVSNLDDSIGLQIDDDGRVASVRWKGPAFRAGLASGARVTQINGQPFSTPSLLAAVAASTKHPLTMAFKAGAQKRSVSIVYSSGLRYPHLERIPGTPDRLSALLSVR